MMTTATAEETMKEPEVLVEVRGQAGVITLNRPKALNALNLAMMREIFSTLKDWEKDPAIAIVLIEGAGDKAFCAGGDIRSVYMARVEENRQHLDSIFREEYKLNAYINQYPKPYIALIDGICMGGGMGVSIHGSHRVVTQKAMLAMPETNIGFFVDIGASHFLNQCPGESGLYMALLAEKFSPADAIYTKLATHYIPSEQLEEAKEKLIAASSAEEACAILDGASKTPPFPSFVQDHQQEIDEIFRGKTVEDIIHNLKKSSYPLADGWFKTISTKSPTSLKLCHRLLRENNGKSLEECLQVEFRLSQKCVERYDFFEGIRAVVIDKDQNPQWQPPPISIK